MPPGKEKKTMPALTAVPDFRNGRALRDYQVALLAACLKDWNRR